MHDVSPRTKRMDIAIQKHFLGKHKDSSKGKAGICETGYLAHKPVGNAELQS